MDQPIGREVLATEEIGQDLLSDSEPTYIGKITTDRDSAAYRGVQRAWTDRGGLTGYLPRRRLFIMQKLLTGCLLDEQRTTGNLPKENSLLTL